MLGIFCLNLTEGVPEGIDSVGGSDILELLFQTVVSDLGR